MLVSSAWTILALITTSAMAQKAHVLIFSATNGFRHESIPIASKALQVAGQSQNIIFSISDDATQFNTEKLAEYDAILFMMTTDNDTNPALDRPQQEAFQTYLNSGGHYIGIHSASDCLHDATFYGRELGAYMVDHLTLAEMTFLNTIEPNHPIVAMIPERWTFTDEVYNFKQDPRAVGSKVVLTVDLSSIGDQNANVHGSPHPIAWYQVRGAGVSPGAPLVGRSFYTSLGHLSTTWQDEIFLGHVMAGIKWVLDARTTRAFNSSGLVGNPSSSAVPISSGSASANAVATSRRVTYSVGWASSLFVPDRRPCSSVPLGSETPNNDASDRMGGMKGASLVATVAGGLSLLM